MKMTSMSVRHNQPALNDGHHERGTASRLPDVCTMLNRRTFLAGAASAAVVGVTAAPTAQAAPAAQAPAPSPRWPGRRPNARTQLTLLGTAGGPPLNSNGRKGISTAVTYNDNVYIVDLGHGSLDQLVPAGLAGPGDTSALQNVRGVLFTHLHSDHTVDWPAMYTLGWANTNNGKIPNPIQVFGPGARGTLDRVSPPTRPAPQVINPEDPHPGRRP